MAETQITNTQVERFKQQIDSEEVDLSNGLFKHDSKTSHYLIRIQFMTKVSILHLERNQNPSILESVSHIKFTNLKRLNLQGNKIVSLQALCFLNVPDLEQVDLTKNKITNVHCLSKLKLSSLKTLKITIDSISNGWIDVFRCQTYVQIILFDSFYSQKHPINQTKLQNLAKSEFNRSIKLRTNQKKKLNPLIFYLKDFKVKKKQF